LNNVIEADHGKLKLLIRHVRGFKTLKTAYAAIKGFEVMRALRKSQAGAFNITRDICGEARARRLPSLRGRAIPRRAART
jgi:transposase, IS6 family